MIAYRKFQNIVLALDIDAMNVYTFIVIGPRQWLWLPIEITTAYPAYRDNVLYYLFGEKEVEQLLTALKVLPGDIG